MSGWTCLHGHGRPSLPDAWEGGPLGREKRWGEKRRGRGEAEELRDGGAENARATNDAIIAKFDRKAISTTR